MGLWDTTAKSNISKQWQKNSKIDKLSYIHSSMAMNFATENNDENTNCECHTEADKYWSEVLNNDTSSCYNYEVILSKLFRSRFYSLLRTFTNHYSQHINVHQKQAWSSVSIFLSLHFPQSLWLGTFPVADMI